MTQFIQKRKINLGCGSRLIQGYENYDLCPISDEVKPLDLNQLPLPFPDNSLDEIRMSHTFEHLSVNKYDFVVECHRVLKDDGVLQITIPVRCATIQHTTEVFDKDYFLDLYSENKGGSTQHGLNLFTLLVFKRKRNTLRMILWKLWHWVETFLYEEYTFELKKNDTDK